MNFGSFKYLIKEGFRNLWHNRFMGITSIGVLVSCLLLSGGAFLIFANVDKIFGVALEENIVMVWATEGSTQTEVNTLGEKLKGMGSVLSAEIYTKEQQLIDFDNKFPESLSERFADGANPFLDGYKVKFNDLTQYAASVRQMEKISGVDEVTSQITLAETLVKIQRVVFVIGGGIVGLLLLISLFIISNTIKLTVYNRRLEVSIMKSVGATNAFVRLPFVIEGMLLGALAAGIAYGLTQLVYTVVFNSAAKSNTTFFFMQELVKFSEVWSVIFIGFIAIGIVTGMLGSAISISKYLKKDGGISGVI